MAENEILDAGNPRRYRNWHRALADVGLSEAQVAECLEADFLLVLRRKLRRNPLYLVLKACQSNPKALQDVVENFKDRALAKLVERAHAIARSNDPQVVAHALADLLVDGLICRANRYAFRHAHNSGANRHAALEQAASFKLEACKPEIVNLLRSSLVGEPIKRKGEELKKRSSAESILSGSLLSSEKNPAGIPPRV